MFVLYGVRDHMARAKMARAAPLVRRYKDLQPARHVGARIEISDARNMGVCAPHIMKIGHPQRWKYRCAYFLYAGAQSRGFVRARRAGLRVGRYMAFITTWRTTGWCAPRHAYGVIFTLY